MGRSDRNSDAVADILAHYGIKGMKWGVRRSQAQLDAASADAQSAAAAREKIKKNRGSTKSLSNKELQDMITRMNLEQQYANLASKNSKMSKGQKRVKSALSVAKTAQEVHSIVNGPLGKAIRTAIVSK